ncbi:nitroreductase family deazaflavin-dependent oxidoreductase [Nocardia rhamnosiphila]|uniref:nitroreductase family deazaflavin-dependent oxidoreductase n=1 Tax=Nocardia rhamnosiphila TaxID=426716 RepID=UPI0004C45DD4|nr:MULTISPECIES: nitroreductase family deazaflavin-dependent oxidoreductase [Nocardia]MCX0271650.1 nitroreductase family deazaflavin-dependent oxidoreductase [Nocardia zapadnayensis]
MADADDIIEMNSQVITEFREKGGTVGGMFEGFPLILVHHKGAKSGVERIAPLVPYVEGDRIFIFASLGGSPKHPAWYHNLVANPNTTVEFGAETFSVAARVLPRAERDEIYAKQVAVQPQFGEYQRKTDRVIPVVELQRTGH